MNVHCGANTFINTSIAHDFDCFVRELDKLEIERQEWTVKFFFPLLD